MNFALSLRLYQQLLNKVCCCVWVKRKPADFWVNIGHLRSGNIEVRMFLHSNLKEFTNKL